jgi:hypothetical protein
MRRYRGWKAVKDWEGAVSGFKGAGYGLDLHRTNKRNN